MAYETNIGADFTLPAAADLSAKQYFLAAVNSSGQAALCTGAAGEAFVGVIQGDDATANRATGLRPAGISKVAAGGTFAAGDLLTSDSNGKTVKYTKATVYTGTPYIVSGSLVYGVALAAGVSGQTSTMLVSPRGLSS